MYVHDKTCLCICYHILPVHVGVVSSYMYVHDTCHVIVGVAFTTSNAQKAVERVWGDGLGLYLCVPDFKQDEIKRQFSRLPQQKQALIKYWKDRNPRASWRSLIVTLDAMKEKWVADDIRRLAEPLSGVYKCS